MARCFLLLLLAASLVATDVASPVGVVALKDAFAASKLKEMAADRGVTLPSAVRQSDFENIPLCDVDTAQAALTRYNNCIDCTGPLILLDVDLDPDFIEDTCPTGCCGEYSLRSLTTGHFIHCVEGCCSRLISLQLPENPTEEQVQLVLENQIIVNNDFTVTGAGRFNRCELADEPKDGCGPHCAYLINDPGRCAGRSTVTTPVFGRNMDIIPCSGPETPTGDGGDQPGGSGTESGDSEEEDGGSDGPPTGDDSSGDEDGGTNDGTNDDDDLDSSDTGETADEGTEGGDGTGSEDSEGTDSGDSDGTGSEEGDDTNPEDDSSPVSGGNAEGEPDSTPGSSAGGSETGEGPSGIVPTEEEVCIDAEALRHLDARDLVFTKPSIARVLCDSNRSCSTPGHVVVFTGKAMMMKTYCEMVGCTEERMHVNSPRLSRRVRIPSNTRQLEYTGFAARYGTRAEEAFLATAVRIGL